MATTNNIKTTYVKHYETFSELEHLRKYVRKAEIKQYTYTFSFAYGYTLYYEPKPKPHELQLIEKLLSDVYDGDTNIILTEEQTIAIEWLYDKYNELTK